jgi:predicted acylesterase/phospholipase RssA
MTLSEFYTATGGRDLSLVASDTTEGQLLVLNHNTAPDLPVVWAVRMSMSIPMVWPEVEWQAGWGNYRGKPITGNLVVDGGLLSNFPIELFISAESHIVQVMGEKKAGSRVLGLLIDESLEVPDAPAVPGAPANGGFSVGQLRFIQRVNRLINTATRAHDKMVLEAFNQLVVRLPAKDYGTTEFGMSEARRNALVAAGAQAMRSYLNFRDMLSFGIQQEATSYQINLAEHADRVASHILD